MRIRVNIRRPTLTYVKTKKMIMTANTVALLSSMVNMKQWSLRPHAIKGLTRSPHGKHYFVRNPADQISNLDGIEIIRLRRVSSTGLYSLVG